MNQGKIVPETAADTNNRQREGAGWASGPMMGRGSRAIFDLRYEDTDPAAACSPKTMYNLIGHSSYPIPTAVYMERCLRIFFRAPRVSFLSQAIPLPRAIQRKLVVGPPLLTLGGLLITVRPSLLPLAVF